MLTETLVVILLEFFDVPYENNYTSIPVMNENE